MGDDEQVDEQQQQQPDKKRAKIDDEGHNDNDVGFTEERVWQHFSNYLESINDNDDDNGGGDVDELHEIINLTKKDHPSIKPVEEAGQDDVATVITEIMSSKESLLPVLLSVVYFIFADQAIGAHLQQQQQQQQQKEDSHQDDDPRDDLEEQLLIRQYFTQSIKYYPYNAATWSMAANYGRMMKVLDLTRVCRWYEHAAELAHETRATCIAHLEREANTATNQTKSDDKEKPDDDDDDDDEESDIKEWIETLLLNQVAGVEWEDDDDDENNGGEEDKQQDDQERKDEEQQQHQSETTDKGGGGSWSASTIESTSRFMAAMQLSIAGKHDQALQKHLKHFCLTHRLDPHLWRKNNNNNNDNRTKNSTETTASESDKRMCDDDDNDDDDEMSSLPVLRFSCQEKTGSDSDGGGGSGSGNDGGILPQSLYQRLCSVFAPNAAYWRESDYANRGYYSYFMDRTSSSTRSTGTSSSSTTTNKGSNNADDNNNNLIRDVIENHLLPLVEQALAAVESESSKINGARPEDKEKDEIVGYEWWVHTRPIQANLGHNLHFDTDETLLSQEKQVTHPIYSSVLYLTGGGGGAENGDSSGGGGGGGPTIVLDQTPDATTVASRGWRSEPRDNSFFIFPGNLLHGVLPCPGESSGSSGDEANTATNDKTGFPDLNDLWKNASNTDKNNNGTQAQPPPKHRLTFMVGFWTRRVPDRMKEQKLYGPCGPLPPANEKEHSWVLEINKGYKNGDKDELIASSSSSSSRARNGIHMEKVASVSPVWEAIKCYPGATTSWDDEVKEKEEEEEPSLDIPHALDHRFFVLNAPTCFRDSLFERDEFDEEEDAQDKEEDEEDESGEK